MNSDPTPKPFVYIAGEIILENFLLSGEGFESFDSHVQQKLKEEPRRTFNRIGGAGLSESLLKELEIDVEREHSFEPEWWSAIARGKDSQGYWIARQSMSLMAAPIIPGSAKRVYRVERSMALEYLQIEVQKGHVQAQLAKLGTKGKGRSYPVILIEDLRLGGITDKKETIENAAACSDRCVIIKTSDPADWIRTLSRAQFDKDVLILGSIDSFFSNKGFASRSWDSVIRDTHQELSVLFEGPEEFGDSHWKAVLLCRNEGLVFLNSEAKHGAELHLAWDAKYGLGGLSQGRSGWVPGCQNVFAAGLIAGLKGEENGRNITWDSIVEAWKCARRAAIVGHGRKRLRDLADAKDLIFNPNKETDPKLYARAEEIKSHQISNCKQNTDEEGVFDRQFRRIIDSIRKESAASLSAVKVHEFVFELGCTVVSRGVRAFEFSEISGSDYVQRFINSIPVYTIGRIVTLDDHESVEITSLMELLRDYSERPSPIRPLSFSVFGRPGSGKSFAVKEILGHLKIPSQQLSFNLSQFSGPLDLWKAFQAIQSAGLSNRLPVVFWDEFDCKLNDLENGWLRYFLAPMQDGEFLSNGERQRLGRAVFVFAGGVSESGADFYSLDRIDKEKRNAKVPDFASRIKAVYNVPSLTFTELDAEKDILQIPQNLATVIRRALVIRHNILQHAPTVAKVSKGVLARLFFDPRYQTARDIETAIEAAPLTSVDSFGESLIPKFAWGTGERPKSCLHQNVDVSPMVHLFRES